MIQVTHLTKRYGSRTAVPAEFHLGYALPSAVLGLAQGILTMGAVWLLSVLRGEGLSFAGCMGAVLCGVPTMVFSIGLGVLLGSLLSSKAAPGISSAIISAASLLGGCWMDAALLGEGFETACLLLPWYPAVRMGRAMLQGGGFHPADLAVTCLWALLAHMVCCCRRKN
ncbi:MAG: hypothetical protein IJ480_07325 [Clostridia bacterium]|nr:hypothetical protein [Clostridia bacterium]